MAIIKLSCHFRSELAWCLDSLLLVHLAKCQLCGCGLLALTWWYKNCLKSTWQLWFGSKLISRIATPAQRPLWQGVLPPEALPSASRLKMVPQNAFWGLWPILDFILLLRNLVSPTTTTVNMPKMFQDISRYFLPIFTLLSRSYPLVLFFYMNVYASSWLTNSRPLTSTFPMNITTYHWRQPLHEHLPMNSTFHLVIKPSSGHLPRREWRASVNNTGRYKSFNPHSRMGSDFIVLSPQYGLDSIGYLQSLHCCLLWCVRCICYCLLSLCGL